MSTFLLNLLLCLRHNKFSFKFDGSKHVGFPVLIAVDLTFASTSCQAVDLSHGPW